MHRFFCFMYVAEQFTCSKLNFSYRKGSRALLPCWSELYIAGNHPVNWVHMFVNPLMITLDFWDESNFVEMVGSVSPCPEDAELFAWL